MENEQMEMQHEDGIELTPPPPAEEQPKPKGLIPGNRFAELFEGLVFRAGDGRVFPPKGGSQRVSMRAAKVTLILRGGFAGVPGTIYIARERPKAPKIAELSLVGGQQVQALEPFDERARVELGELKRYVVAQYLVWRRETPSAGATTIKSSAIVVDDAELDASFDAE
jgi:hypothetical protein